MAGTNEFGINKRVWSFNFGWGIVIYENESDYPWVVEFEDKTRRSYTRKDVRIENERQSLFLNEFKIPEIISPNKNINLTILSEISF